MRHPHGVAKSDESVSDAGLGGADRELEHGRHLRVRVAAEVGQLECLALHRREAGQRLADPTRLERGRGGLGGRVVLDRLVALVVRRVPPGRRLGGPDPVDRLAVHDGEQPPERAALRRVEPARRLPDLEERLLGDLLGLGHVADHPDRKADDAAGRRVVQLRRRRPGHPSRRPSAGPPGRAPTTPPPGERRRRHGVRSASSTRSSRHFSRQEWLTWWASGPSR